MTPKRRRRDRGLATIELAVIAVPVLAGCVLLVLYAGRVGQAENEVRASAQAAARAASLRADPVSGAEAARATAESNLATAGLTCTDRLNVQTTGDWSPGGTVTVTVTCTGSMRDVLSLAVPASHTVSKSATEVVDRHRSGGPGFGISEGSGAGNSGVGGG